MAAVLLYGGRIKAELVIVSVDGRLLVDGLPAKGDAQNGTSTPVLINNPWSSPEWIAKSTFEPVYATYEDMAVILA